MASVGPVPTSGGAPPPPASLLPKKITFWETVVSFFQNLFHSERHFTEEMKRKITLAKLSPHVPTDVSAKEEDEKFKESLLKFIGKTLKNRKQEKEIGRFYDLLYKMVGRVTEKKGEVERLRREHLPTILAELLQSEEGESGEQRELFAALCPFFTNGRLELDPTRPEDRAIISPHESFFDWLNPLSAQPSVSLQELIAHFGDRAKLTAYLVAKFKTQMEKDPDRANAFLETMGNPQDPKLNVAQQKSNLENIAALLVPKVVDAFLERVKGKGDTSPLVEKVKEAGDLGTVFDQGIEILKKHLESLEVANQKQAEVRHTIDELRAVLLTGNESSLDEEAVSLVGNIWGDEESLLEQTGGETRNQLVERRKAFLNSPTARKREDYYLKEIRYREMKIEGEDVGQAALEVIDNLNWARKVIRHEKNRPALAEEDLKAILDLRHLITTGATLSNEAEEIALMIWPNPVVIRDGSVEEKQAYFKTEEADQRQKAFIEDPPVHFVKHISEMPQSPRKTRPLSPTGPRTPVPLHWKVEPNEVQKLTVEKKKELDELCKTTWGMGFQELVALPNIDREYAFREVAYKNYVKDKRAGQIATVVSNEINAMLSDTQYGKDKIIGEAATKATFLDDLIETLKTSGELGPLGGLLNDENFVRSIKTLLPALVTNGTKWALKNTVADMFLEGPQLKRLVDEILPDSIEAVHTVLIKTLLQQRLPDLASALLDPNKKKAIISEIKRQYEWIVKKELLEKPPFDLDKVLGNVFQTIEKDLGAVITEIKGNDTLSEKEKQNTMLEVMKFYLKSMPGVNNPIYSDLVAVAAFDMGEIPPSIKALWGSWPVKTTMDKLGINLNTIITSSLYPYRKSHREVMRILTKKFETMATKEPPTTVPFEIRIPYRIRPAAPERIEERDALLKVLKENTAIGSGGTIPGVGDKNPELIIRFEANKKWLEENDTKTVSEILTALRLAPFIDQLIPDHLQMPLREKMIADKMQKLVRPILTIAKVNLGIGVATSFFGRIKAAISEHFITKYVTETRILKLIDTVMKKTLFLGLLYPQDTIAPTTSTAKSLSSRSIMLIESRELPETRHLLFARDEEQTPQGTKTNPLADPHPNIKIPAVKRFASLLSDGILVIIPAFLTAKAWLFQSALTLTGQASRTETQAIVRRLLQTADFTPPKQGGWETNSAYKIRYDNFIQKVRSTLNGLRAYAKDKEIIELINSPEARFTGEEKDRILQALRMLMADGIEDFLNLPLPLQHRFYTALQNHVVNKLLATNTIMSTEEKIGRTLATNLVLRSGAEAEIKVAPMQGADWTEKLLYPLLDKLEADPDYLIARSEMRALGIKRGIPEVKGYQLAALMEAEKRKVGGKVEYDPITAYLRTHKEELEPLLRPLLLSLVPPDLQDYTIDELIPENPNEEWPDYLSKITSSQRLMGLLMREVGRAQSPFYPLLDYLEKKQDFIQIRGRRNIETLKAYFEEHLEKDSSFAELFRPVLTSFQKPEAEEANLSKTTQQLYEKYKDELFLPQPLFKENFKGLMRDPTDFSQLLRPILEKFHSDFSTDDLSLEDLYTQHLPELTEAAFEKRIKEDVGFGSCVGSLILHFLSDDEKKEIAGLESKGLFERYKRKLFEPNLHVSLMMGDTVRKTPPLYEKLAEILIPTLVGDIILKLQDLDKNKRLIKNSVDRAAKLAHLHFEGLLAVERKKPEAALAAFKDNKKSMHPVLKNRNAKGVDPDYEMGVKQFTQQLVKQLRSTFLTDPEKDKLVRLLWDRKGEVIPLTGLDPVILEGLLSEKDAFTSFVLTLLESFMVPIREEIANVIKGQILDKSEPKKFQRILLNAIPAITNVLKPLILSTLFIQDAQKKEELSRLLWHYTQKGAGDIGKKLDEFSKTIDGVTFTPEQVLEVEKSLFEKYSKLPPAATLDAFKGQMKATVVKKVDFAEHLIKNGFKGGRFSSDKLKVGIKTDEEIAAFHKVADDERNELAKKGISFDEAEFNLAKEKVLKALQSDSTKGLTSTPARDNLLKQLGLKKSEAYGPLVSQFASKIINTVVPTSFLQSTAIAAFRYTATETINDAVVDVLKPIIESENPVATLSTLLQPAITDVLNRDTFTKKGDEKVPDEDAFKESTEQLGKLLELWLIPDTVKKFIGAVGSSVSGKISDTIAKTLFDLTNEGWKNENLILHVITAISEQLDPPEN